MERTWIISTLVENKPGVLQRVASMFRSRWINIESLTVGPIQSPDLSRMTIVIKGDEKKVRRVAKHLRKLIDVIEVKVLEEQQTVFNELALLKVSYREPEVRSDILNLVNIFGYRIVHADFDSMIVELVDTPDKIESFMKLLEPYGIIEFARTGVTALPKVRDGYEVY